MNMLIGLGPTGVQRATTLQSLSQLVAWASGQEGGTAAFFQARDQIYQLNEAIAQNPTGWVPGTNSETGQPNYSFSAGSAQLTLTPTIDTDVLLNQSEPSGTFEWDGNTYYIVGSTEIQLSTGNYQWVSSAVVGVTVFLATNSLLQSFFSSLLQQLVAGSNAGAQQLYNALEDGADIDAAAADTEGTDAVAAVVDLGEIAAMTGCFLGLTCAVAILYIVEEFILHITNHRITVVNLTPNAIVWSTPFIFEGNPTILPCQPAGQDPDAGYVVDCVIPGMQQVGPKNMNPVTVYCDAEFGYQSTDSFSGLGYVFQFTFTDQGSGETYNPVVMFDIPFTGANSLGATFDAVNAYPQWYYDLQGQNTETQFAISSPDGAYSVTVTYDYLTGEHLDPSGETTGYYYNSMIVISG